MNNYFKFIVCGLLVLNSASAVAVKVIEKGNVNPDIKNKIVQPLQENEEEMKKVAELWLKKYGEPMKMRREDTVVFEVCGDIVLFTLQNSTDGPKTYFNNIDASLIANCSFWSCRDNPSSCKDSCPPEGWQC